MAVHGSFSTLYGPFIGTAGTHQRRINAGPTLIMMIPSKPCDRRERETAKTPALQDPPDTAASPPTISGNCTTSPVHSRVYDAGRQRACGAGGIGESIKQRGRGGRRLRTHTAVSYIPKLRKNVLLLSTKHHERAVSNTEKMKPLIIMDYDRCKGCVDNLDKVIATYSCRKRTHRWPLVLFYHLLDISVYNAYVLWTAVDPTWNKAKTYRRRTFIEELGKTLVAPHMARRPRLPREASAVAMIKELQDREPISENYNPRRRGTCDFCTGKRKRCTMSCSKCGRFVCKVHSTCICNSCRFCSIVNLQ
ncbi:hypothetical protein JOB18_002629 [Solea senegalensis]|uniref:PiggyBac transposable element-derived protein domain-containing protein n=1 Tax=Solea senegalensis TaxID=28829 RepID=A0AAV6S025_SOLSE|nr:hypothetical protein JOB18_002629 [Solea senegalensis]